MTNPQKTVAGVSGIFLTLLYVKGLLLPLIHFCVTIAAVFALFATCYFGVRHYLAVQRRERNLVGPSETLPPLIAAATATVFTLILLGLIPSNSSPNNVQVAGPSDLKPVPSAAPLSPPPPKLPVPEKKTEIAIPPALGENQSGRDSLLEKATSPPTPVPFAFFPTKEPDLSGIWTLSSMTVFENGMSQNTELAIFGEKLNAQFDVNRSKTGYSVVPIQVGSEASRTFDMKINASGKNFIAEVVYGSKKMKAIVHFTPAELRAVVNPKSPDTAPPNFETPTGKSEVRIDLKFVRPKAESIVWVKGPKGATASIGDWSEMLEDAAMGIRTEILPTDRETPFDVVVEISADGQTTRDRIRVWAVGGTESKADFSDISTPDTAVRTLRYWESCTKTLHRHLDEAASTEDNIQKNKTLSELPGELRTTPARGVDTDAVNKWLALVTTVDSLLANQRREDNGDLAVEAFVRGLTGDPFGTARDAQLLKKVGMDAFEKSFLELKNAAALLTAKYGTEFPVP